LRKFRLVSFPALPTQNSNNNQAGPVDATRAGWTCPDGQYAFFAGTHPLKPRETRLLQQPKAASGKPRRQIVTKKCRENNQILRLDPKQECRAIEARHFLNAK